MHAATVDLLVKKAHFEPYTALAVAEAIDMAIATAELVTVPVLDARLAELRTELKVDIADLKAEIRDVKADLVRWVLLAMLGSAALSSGATAVVKALG